MLPAIGLLTFNCLTTSVAYIRVFIFYWHIKHHLLNMVKIKYDINQQYLKTVYRHFVKSNNFHSLEVVDRVSKAIFLNLNNFTHLKLWIASARHNFKWVKIQIQ